MASTKLGESVLMSSGHDRVQAAIDQISALVEENLPEEQYFARILSVAHDAVAADAGVVWKRIAEGGVRLVCQRDAPSFLTEANPAAAQHGQLIIRVFASGTCLLVPSHSADVRGECPNPSDNCLFLAPIKTNGSVHFVLELFRSSDLSPSAQLECLAFVKSLCEAAEGFLQARELRLLRARQAMWTKIEDFGKAIHSTLSSTDVCYAIANEARGLVGCDRVSVAIRFGRQYQIQAVSGQQTLDTRAETIRLLNQLVTTTARTTEPFWFNGVVDGLPPQIEAALEDYVEKSHSKLIGITPLSSRDSDDATPTQPLGALIVEQIEDTRAAEGFKDRVSLVCDQSALALANALEHEQIFLLSVWRAIGKSRVLLQARTLPKTISAFVLLLLVTGFLTFVPYDFNVHTTGTLQPMLRREVFAAADGTVDRIFIQHGERVEKGRLLAQLRNTDLDVSITDVAGQIAAAHEQLNSAERSLVHDGKRLTPEERNRLSGQRSELRERLSSLKCQLTLLQEKRSRLEVVSPLRGEITTWNVAELLDQRPVRQGDILMSVAVTEDEWELELRVPESRMGFVSDAQRELGSDLQVVYRLATDPATDHEGTVRAVHLTAEVRGDEGNTVLVRASIDKANLAHLQPGAECRAKIQCGRRAIGYVIFHDVVAFIQSRILFRL